MTNRVGMGGFIGLLFTLPVATVRSHDERSKLLFEGHSLIARMTTVAISVTLFRMMNDQSHKSKCNMNGSLAEPAGNSIKDDSLYSSSTQKQSIDSVALSRGHSVKRFNHDRSGDCEKFDRPQMFASKVMMASSAHLNLYTQEQELCLNIYPSNDSLSHQPTENLSRISIQLNRLSSDETNQHSLHRPHICPSVISPASASQPTMPGTAFAATSLDENLNQSNRQRKLPNDVTNLDLICSQQGEIKIFIKRKKHHQDSRLKLWKYLHRMSPLKGKQHHHNRHPTAVHFYSPVLCSQKESVEDDHSSHASSTANMYPIGFNMPVSEGQEDDLEAYMKEIKLRENQSGPIP